jgi:hypothetical protein
VQVHESHSAPCAGWVNTELVVCRALLCCAVLCRQIMRTCATEWSRCQSWCRSCRLTRLTSHSSWTRWAFFQVDQSHARAGPASKQAVTVLDLQTYGSIAAYYGLLHIWKNVASTASVVRYQEYGCINMNIGIDVLWFESSDCCCCLCCFANCSAVLQRDQALAAAAAAAASARESSSLPTSPTAARALRPNFSGGPNSTGSVTSPGQGGCLGALAMPLATGEQAVWWQEQHHKLAA